MHLRFRRPGHAPSGRAVPSGRGIGPSGRGIGPSGQGAGTAAWRRAVVWTALAALAVQAGCAGGTRTLTRDELADPEPASSYLVTTRSGETITFIALHLEGEVLRGTVRLTQENVVGEGEQARTTVTNRYEERSIPWAEVASVEADRGEHRLQGAAWIAAGSVLVGAVLFLVLSQGGDEQPKDDGGKVPPVGAVRVGP